MRILYCHRTRGEGAEGIHISQIIRSLRDLGNCVEVLSPGGQNRTFTKANVFRIKEYMPKILFRSSEICYNIHIYRTALRAIQTFGPSLVYERYALFNFGSVKAAKDMGIPLILEVNTPYSYAWAKYDKMYFSTVARKIEKYVMMQADAIVTVSNVLKRYLIKMGIPAYKIFPMHNGVNLDMFDPGIQSRELKQKLDAEGKVVVGFVGSLKSWHGIDVFMKSIYNICLERKDAHFLIVGDGDKKNEFENYIKERNISDRVTFTGRVDHSEIPMYLSAMDIGVMANSNFYGSPMKIFEYMAMELAVVAPRQPAIEEVITHEFNGYMVEPGSESSLEEGLIYLIDNPELRRNCGVRARQLVSSEYTWDRNAKKIIEIYRQITSANLKKNSPQIHADFVTQIK